MAKVWGCPKELAPAIEKFSFDEDWDKQEKKAHELLRKYCKMHTDSKNPLVGVVFRVPCADSYAQYMVFRTKPLELIHIPFGDAWDAPDYQTRGIRLKDIKAQVEFDKQWEKLGEK